MATPERTQLIEKIQRLPTQIEHLVDSMTEAELSGRFVAGEWSAAQNVHHLADSHINSYIRCKLIATETHPTLKPYDQDAWAALPDAGNRDVSTSLAILRGLHARWVRFFSELDDASWLRTGFHPEAGVVTLDDQLRLYAGHGEGHIEQIRRTIAARYPKAPTSKTELLIRIDREWERLNRLIQHYTPTQWELPISGGWPPKLHLGHVTAWERWLVGHHLRGEPGHVALGLGDDPAFSAHDIDRINELIAAQTMALPIETVLENFRATHQVTRDIVAAMSWDEITPVLYEDDPLVRPRLDWILGNTADHYLEHWQWLPVF